MSSNASELARAFVPLAVLGASLAGSLHCVGMCGGLVASVAQTRRDVVLYHLGRLLGYGTLGGLAGLLGERLFKESFGSMSWVSYLAAFALGLGFIALGVRVWREKPLHVKVPDVFQRSYFSLFRQMNVTSFSTGLFSVFLPCGWLHSFVLGAVATRSPWTGAAFLSLFWLGSVPALAATPLLVRKVLQPISVRAPKVSGTLLVVAGVVALSYRIPAIHARHRPAHGEAASHVTEEIGKQESGSEHCPHHSHSLAN